MKWVSGRKWLLPLALCPAMCALALLFAGGAALASGEHLDANRVFRRPVFCVEEYEFFGLTAGEVRKKISDLQAVDKIETYEVSDDVQSISIHEARSGGTLFLKYAQGKVVAVKRDSYTCRGTWTGEWVDSQERALLKALVSHSQEMDFAYWRLRTRPKGAGGGFGAFEEVSALQDVGMHLTERAHILRLLGMPEAAQSDEIGSGELIPEIEKRMPKLTRWERNWIINGFADPVAAAEFR
jgi:hypothetical protein